MNYSSRSAVTATVRSTQIRIRSGADGGAFSLCALFLGVGSGLLFGTPAAAQLVKAWPEEAEKAAPAREAEKAEPAGEAQGEEVGADQAEAAAAARREAAKAAYRQGKEAFLARDYETALERFEVSYKSTPSPNSRLMKARTLKMLGRRPEALYELRQAAREAEQTGERRYRASASAANWEAAELEKELGAITASMQVELAANGEQTEAAEPAGSGAQVKTGERSQAGQQAKARLQGAVLMVGGLRIERDRWSEGIPVEAGFVSVQLEAADGQSDAKKVRVNAGEVVEVALTLPAPLPEPEPELVAPVRVKIDSRGADLRMAGMIASGVGVVGIGVFVGCGLASNVKLADLEQACPERTGCDTTLRDDADAGDTLQTAANLGLVVGALSIAAGVTLYVLGSMDERSAVALGPGSVWIRGEL